MNDPRLEEWLEETRRALAAPDTDRLESISAACEARERLMGSLIERPADAPDPELARELEVSENAFQSLVAELPKEIQTRLGELRRVKQAARGYLPPTPSDPTLVSREV